MDPNNPISPQNPNQQPIPPQQPSSSPQPVVSNYSGQQGAAPNANPVTGQQLPNYQPAYAAPITSSNTEQRKLPIVPIVAGALILMLLLGGAGFALTNSNNEQENNENPAVTAPAEENEPVAEEQPKASRGQIIPLDKTIVDEEMGYTIKATSLGIGNLAIPERYKANNSDKSVVTIHFVNTDTNKFAGSAKNLVLSLITSDGDKIAPTSLNNEELKAAGMVSLSDATEANNTVEGEVVFWVESTKLDKLTLRYKRLGANIIGTTQQIPTKEFDVVLR